MNIVSIQEIDLGFTLSGWIPDTFKNVDWALTQGMRKGVVLYGWRLSYDGTMSGGTTGNFISSTMGVYHRNLDGGGALTNYPFKDMGGNSIYETNLTKNKASGATTTGVDDFIWTLQSESTNKTLRAGGLIFPPRSIIRTRLRFDDDGDRTTIAWTHMKCWMMIGQIG